MMGRVRMGLSFRIWWAAVLMPLFQTSPASAEVCLFQKDKNDAYYVLGSRVEPQSDVLIAGDCNASFALLNEQYLNAARMRLAPGKGTRRSDASACQPNHAYKRGCASTE